MRLTVIALALMSLTACAGGPSLGGFGGGGENYAAASVLGAQLEGGDVSALQPAFTQAMNNGGDGERFDWRGPKAFGWVKARAPRVGNLKPDPEDRPEIPAGLILDETFETEQGLYALKSNANVRLGPSTDDPVLQQLNAGLGVDVIGKVVGKPWMLSAVDGKVVGYIHDSLMIKAPGTELLLAGGPRRPAVYCRGYEQRISYGGRSDLWEGVACRENGEWALKALPENQPVRLY
ncbi:MAG: SH3 domain-containing protein [Parvularculaceae bacterium]|nr:SH3 domain-containing protein [Parvularculaceae bacterium]